MERFSFSHERQTLRRVRLDVWHVPYWPLWLITTPPIVWWLLLEARRRFLARRREQNLCVECGYDLRASAGRCPECGMPSVQLT
jgi:hypothetical protein